jgi:GNAT superfamily N-acetyltransferase
LGGSRLIEPIAARGWPAAECGALGGWRLHASSGWSGRINTCWPLAAPDRPVEAAIDAVEAWYRARGLPPRFKLAEGAIEPPDLPERLAARGYQPSSVTLTMLGPLNGQADADVRIIGAPDQGFRAVFADADFGPPGDAEERLAALERIPRPRGFAVLEIGDASAAIGVCAADGAWAGLMAMRTAPAFRRRGLARRVLSALTAFGRTAGAARGYLQVDEDNHSAVALYRSEGFESSYGYRYWTRC